MLFHHMKVFLKICGRDWHTPLLRFLCAFIYTKDSHGFTPCCPFLKVLLLINCSCDTPDHNRAVCAALTHHGHPCGNRHLHCLSNIRNDGQQNIPCDRMKQKYPPRITGFSANEHYSYQKNFREAKYDRDPSSGHIIANRMRFYSRNSVFETKTAPEYFILQKLPAKKQNYTHSMQTQTNDLSS